jgi:hypothetical protein
MSQSSSVLLANASSAWHVPDERLEAYALGKSMGEHARYFEAHLLACDDCCLRLMREAQFIEALRCALRDFQARDADYSSPAEDSSSSRNPMTSRKAPRTSAGCPS